MKLKITVTWEPSDRLWGFSEMLEEMPDATTEEKKLAIMELITDCDPYEIWSEGEVQMEISPSPDQVDIASGITKFR